ncbi:hypothetical protein ACWEWX_11230 [Streptomyces asiaticus]
MPATVAPSRSVVIDDVDITLRRFASFHGIQDAAVLSWEHATAADGAPMVTAEVTGSEALILVKSFTSDGLIAPHRTGDVRPLLDVSVPGRMACVWRTGGVWVSLWALEPETPALPPSPAPERAEAAVGRFRSFFGPTYPTHAA